MSDRELKQRADSAHSRCRSLLIRSRLLAAAHRGELHALQRADDALEQALEACLRDRASRAAGRTAAR